MKILFAPHEIGGQMQIMAEELRRRGYFATAATYTQEWYGHVSDIHLSTNRVKSKLRKHLRVILFSLWAASNYDIFHFFWGKSLYGFDFLPHLDLSLLRRLNKKIIVHFRGTDVIDIAYFDYLNGMLLGENLTEPPISRPEQLKSLNKWRRYADHLLISWPGLFRVIPEATVVPQAIDLDYWQPSRPHPLSHEDGIIRIAHAPSRRRTKGTKFVIKAVSDLQQHGYPVELVLIENMPYDRVKSIYERCDIGIDQLLYGWYGKVSVELMALGRPVICYIDKQWLGPYPSLPIVNADHQSLTHRIDELVINANLRQSLGKEGRSFVSKHHAVKVIIDQWLNITQG
ncbi:hypothetical protein ACFLZW_00575 [Chloroflexota bacterium]